MCSEGEGVTPGDLLLCTSDLLLADLALFLSWSNVSMETTEDIANKALTPQEVLNESKLVSGYFGIMRFYEAISILHILKHTHRTHADLQQYYTHSHTQSHTVGTFPCFIPQVCEYHGILVYVPSINKHYVKTPQLLRTQRTNFLNSPKYTSWINRVGYGYKWSRLPWQATLT